MAEGDNPQNGYEYLDHTADVQLHAWGSTMEEAFANCALAMYGYMTEIDKVDATDEQVIEAKGEDMISLLFHFLDETLFLFCTEPFFIGKKVTVEKIDRENFSLTATCRGEEFDLSKHPQGTEVKAITYSNMQVHEPEQAKDGLAHVFVIIDI